MEDPIAYLHRTIQAYGYPKISNNEDRYKSYSDLRKSDMYGSRRTSFGDFSQIFQRVTFLFYFIFINCLRCGLISFFFIENVFIACLVY